MIYFTLSNFYQNYNINDFLIKYYKQYPERFKYNELSFSISGAFPYSTWNGGLSNNRLDFPIQQQYSMFKKLDIPIRYNCTNICLDENDFYDEHMNIILNIGEDKKNLIEISNFSLMEYLKIKYPLYNFILSDAIYYLQPYDIKIINNFIDTNLFTLIKLPIFFNSNIDQLKNINQPNMIELNINSICPIDCQNYINCNIFEDMQQLQFIKNSQKFLCEKNINTKKSFLLDINTIEKNFLPIGINHFYIQPNICTNLIEQAFILFNYFLKKEYLDNAFLEYLNEEKNK